MATSNDYIERVSQAVSDGTRHVYTCYWNRIRHAWGADVSTNPLRWKSRLPRGSRVVVAARRNARWPLGRRAHHRCTSLPLQTAADGLIAETANPAIRVANPRRLASTRRALPDGQLALDREGPGDPHR